MQNLLVLGLLIFSFCTFAGGQTRGEAVLVDEFGVLSCEQQRGRLDVFFKSLTDRPDTTGYAVVYGDKTEPLWRIYWQSAMLGHREYRKLAPERLVVLRGSDLDGGKVALWIVPPGGKKPDFPVASYALDQGIKTPTKFAPIGIEIYCPTDVSAEQRFFWILEANPALRGKVIIKERTNAGFERARSELLKKSGKVAQDRLDIVHQKGADDSELWLMPK